MKAFARGLSRQLPLFPIMLAAAVVPLVVRLRLISLDGARVTFGSGARVSADFFSFYKVVLLLACGAAGLVMLLCCGRARLCARKVSWLFTGYALVILLSALQSEHPGIAWFGFNERYEGAWVLLTYLVLALCVMCFATTDATVRVILFSILLCGTAIGVISLLQALGHDPLQTRLGLLLIAPPELRAGDLAVVPKHAAHRVYGTLYNPNYLGSYCAMLCPLALGLLVGGHGRALRVLAALTFGLLFASLLSCGSRGGLLACLFAALLLWVLLRKRFDSRSSIRMGALLLLVGAVVGFGLPDMPRRTLAALRTDIHAVLADKPPRNVILSITTREQSLTVKTTEESLTVTMDQGRLRFDDGLGQALRATPEGLTIRLNDARYALYALDIRENNRLVLRRGDIRMRFAWLGDAFVLVNGRGQVLNTGAEQELAYDWRYTLGSGRPYIWARTLALLPSRVLLGAGPDCFASVFPQDDPRPKLNLYGTTDVVIDKPHNAYLQTSINTGGVSLVLLLLLLFCGLRQCLIGSVNAAPGSVAQHAGPAVLAALAGYAVSMVFNDSVVSVAPVFWVLLGLGLALNESSKATSGRSALKT